MVSSTSYDLIIPPYFSNDVILEEGVKSVKQGETFLNIFIEMVHSLTHYTYFKSERISASHGIFYAQIYPLLRKLKIFDSLFSVSILIFSKYYSANVKVFCSTFQMPKKSSKLDKKQRNYEQI